MSGNSNSTGAAWRLTMRALFSHREVEKMANTANARSNIKIEIRRAAARLSHRLPFETFVILMTIGLWIFLAVATPIFISRENILNLMRQVSISAIIAFGVLFTIIIGRNWDRPPFRAECDENRPVLLRDGEQYRSGA